MIKKRVLVEAQNGNFELWIPNIEEELRGGIIVQEFNRVKSFRVGAGLTQEQMADALGMSKPTYVNRENGIGDWKLSEMQKFAETVSLATGTNYNVKDIFF